MNGYRIEITRAARKDLEGLGTEVARRIDARILALAHDPRPASALPLHGIEGWRMRVGDYRVLYTIDDRERVVVVGRVGHRREVYRGM